MNYVIEKPHQFYQENLPSRILNNIVSVSNSIEDIISNMAPAAITSASWALTAIIVSYSVHPVFSCILFIWLILVVLSSIVMSRKLATRLDSQALAQSIVAEEMEDSLSHQSNVRMFSRKSFETSRMEKFFKKYQKAYTETHTYILIRYSVQGGLITIMMGCSCYFLLILYKRKLVTIGDFSLISGLSFDLGHMIWSSLTALDEFNRVASLCRQSLKALMLPLEIPDKPNAAVLKCTQGRISFDPVKFHYKDNKPLFENQSIDIQGGQKVGLVGYSGGGKSTFVHLILRLYDVTDGAILIDGQDISDVTQDSLRKNISMIPQDPSLFHRSLMENIRYGRIDASDEEVIESTKKAHAHGFIEKLPQGYDSLVGERGVKLSGGQRQRIAIARAILKNAPILILDEATSQLDSVTESLIQESLWELMQNKTTIVIAHRLSTLLHMDRILVFDKGKIVEDGTHSELLVKAGLYKHLWDAQVGGFLGDDAPSLETSFSGTRKTEDEV